MWQLWVAKGNVISHTASCSALRAIKMYVFYVSYRHPSLTTLNGVLSRHWYTAYSVPDKVRPLKKANWFVRASSLQCSHMYAVLTDSIVNDPRVNTELWRTASWNNNSFTALATALCVSTHIDFNRFQNDKRLLTSDDWCWLDVIFWRHFDQDVLYANCASTTVERHNK